MTRYFKGELSAEQEDLVLENVSKELKKACEDIGKVIGHHELKIVYKDIKQLNEMEQAK